VFRISTQPYNIYVVSTNIFAPEERGKSGLISAALSKSLCESEERQMLICKLIKNNPHRKFIALQRVTSGIESLVEKLRTLGIESDSLYGSKKSYKNSRVLVGTIPKMGTGFDEENACDDFYLNPEKSNTLIFINSVKKESLFEQVRGRVMRSDNPHVIWLMDNNASVLRHFNGLKNWIAKTNGNIVYVPNVDDLILP
jgi:hypothetical protein